MFIDPFGFIHPEPPPAAPERPVTPLPLPSGLGYVILGEEPPMEYPHDGGPSRPAAPWIATVARLAVRR